nr:MAG TPA: hypothetical protein [Caudoviricetes sp.]
MLIGIVHRRLKKLYFAKDACNCFVFLLRFGLRGMIQRKIANLNEGFPLSLKVGIIFCQHDDKSERSVATLGFLPLS